jgi:hypothetical protein
MLIVEQSLQQAQSMLLHAARCSASHANTSVLRLDLPGRVNHLLHPLDFGSDSGMATERARYVL